ncbi:phosphoribosyltransferase family protein [Bryobacter aggregatus]|uniref:phosphoribosyltransferase family protein n=1 Tax=Bryobacter aggregatus TaxID=360054 RepID=UPI00068F842C|nr:phosphoribosyltransferase family protein [Bryobacter aggregatus]
MQLLPTQEEVVDLLRKTGALRQGHFVYPDGSYTNEYLQVALAMMDYHHAKVLSVALSRKIRSNTELRAMIPNLSIVAPATGGLPVAYGIVEALGARQIYWAEEDVERQPQRFRQFVEPKPGDKILLVDDILRTGRKLIALKKLVESYGAEVVGLAVMIYQPWPDTPDFAPLPLFHLAKLDSFAAREIPSALKDNETAVTKVWI